MIVWLWWIYIVANHELICSVETIPPNYPTDQQLIDACPYDPTPFMEPGIQEGRIKIAFYEITKPDPPAPFCTAPAVPIGTAMLETPEDATGLYTQNDYGWLSYELRWNDRHETVEEWQNIFNMSLYNAALGSEIPAHLLKRVIGLESQFWVKWSPPDGEVGLMQVTDAGADVLLRYDEGMFSAICPEAVFNCKKGYHILTVGEQQLIRDALRARLLCHGCTVDQALEHERINMPIYARLLRAYGCRNGWNWHDAMLDYNGSLEYLARLGL